MSKKCLFSLGVIVLYALPAVVIISSLLAPYLESRRLEVSSFLYLMLSPLCHQRPSRSLWIFGSPMALDARCFAIYTAFLATGLCLWSRMRRPRLRIAIVLLLPMFVDGFTQLLGYRESTNILRLLTGALAGVGLGLVLFPMTWRACLALVRPAEVPSLGFSLKYLIPGMITVSSLVVSVGLLTSSSAQVPERRPVILREGTTIAMKAVETISSETAHTGQQVQFEVVRDVTVDDVVVIKAGAPAIAEVLRASPRKAVGREGELIIAIRYAKAVDGTNVRLRASLTEKGEDSLTSTVVLSIVLCPLFLLQKGGEATIPAGAEYKVFVDLDTKIDVAAKKESFIRSLKEAYAKAEGPM